MFCHFRLTILVEIVGMHLCWCLVFLLLSLLLWTHILQNFLCGIPLRSAVNLETISFASARHFGVLYSVALINTICGLKFSGSFYYLFLVLCESGLVIAYRNFKSDSSGVLALPRAKAKTDTFALCGPHRSLCCHCRFSVGIPGSMRGSLIRLSFLPGSNFIVLVCVCVHACICVWY